MSCLPHPQVVSPCADDAVSVGQVLGTSGDLAFDEQGSVALTIDQTSGEVTFGYQKETSDYRFEQLYIRDTHDDPVDVRAVPKGQTQYGFTFELTGQPITATCTLYWRVVVPDALHSCPSATGAPRYGIVPPPQQGTEALVVDQDFVEVIFPTEQPDNTWEFEALEITSGAIDIPMVFSWTVAEKSTVGFKLMFQGKPDVAGYTLRWRIAGTV